MNSYNPIKRSDAFVPFSRDHHFVLLLVWKIREDLAKKISVYHIGAYVRTFYEDRLQPHLKKEEELVFVHLQESGQMRKRAENGHREILKILERISCCPGDTLLLREFADILEAHIRFEERVLFNYLQANLSGADEQDVLVHLKKSPDESKAGNIFALNKVFN